MKKNLKALVILVSALMMTVTTYAKSEQIKLGKKELAIDVQEQNGRKLYPLRRICNELGIDIIGVNESYIDLKQDTNNVRISRKSRLVINSTGYFVSDVVPLNINDTVYVPIRTIAFMFGYNINISNGITLTKIKDFSMPKASYGSTLLANDFSIVSNMGDIVEPEYYLDKIASLIQNPNFMVIDDCKEYIINDQYKLEEIAENLMSQSGKAVYEAYYDLLDRFYDIFYNMYTINYSEVSTSIKNMGQAINKLGQKLDIFYNEIYKNGTLIK